MGIAENLAEVRRRIDEACAAAGRDPAEVRLLPVSKTKPPAAIQEAYDAGIRLFGENKVQEAVAKAEVFADLPELRWAVIGHLQTNKAKQVAAIAAEFHALDSLRVATALDRRLRELGRTLDVFVQVNSSGEESKFGLRPEEVPAFARELEQFETLRVRGLMTLAVFSDDVDLVGACFARMRDLQARLQDSHDHPRWWRELSMGMSGDYELAIGYGATTVRVGQAIFGNRLNPTDYWPASKR
ncbi:MAG: YggS family pyridoxal phosphate-dependent enzyme [Microlunatus sp.]